MMSHHGLPHDFDNNGASATLELSIETLTGTTFEVKVLASETILTIKTKIQTVEGIPVPSQHLLYNLEELDNDASISDYNIPNGGRLKLILSMRVGPISTKRFPPVDDVAWRELQELMSDTRKDDLYERLPPGTKMTVLIFHDGDQINFLKVLEHEDGSLSPLTDSWTGSSIRTLFTGGYNEESDRREEENSVTMTKIQDLKQKLESLSIQKKEKKAEEPVEEEPDTSITIRRSDSKTENPRNNKVVSYLCSDLHNPSCSFKLIRKTQKEIEAAEAALHRKRLLSYSKIAIAGLNKARQEAENIIRMQKLSVYVDSESSQSYGLKRPPLPEIRRSPPSDKEKVESQDEKGDNNLREKTARSFAIVEEENAVSSAPSICSSQSSIVALPSSQDVTAAIAVSPVSRDRVSTTVSRSIYKVSRYVLENDERPKTTPTPAKVEARKVTKHDAGAPAKPKRTNSILAKISSLVPITKVINVHMGKETELDIREFSRKAVQRKEEEEELAKANQQPVVKKRLRCSKCKKKLNITNTYSCRCSGVFCSVHRYSEVHDCPFDYKREGRRMLRKLNPMISTTKLPKI